MDLTERYIVVSERFRLRGRVERRLVAQVDDYATAEILAGSRSLHTAARHRILIVANPRHPVQEMRHR